MCSSNAPLARTKAVKRNEKDTERARLSTRAASTTTPSFFLSFVFRPVFANALPLHLPSLLPPPFVALSLSWPLFLSLPPSVPFFHCFSLSLDLSRAVSLSLPPSFPRSLSLTPSLFVPSISSNVLPSLDSPRELGHRTTPDEFPTESSTCSSSSLSRERRISADSVSQFTRQRESFSARVIKRRSAIGEAGSRLCPLAAASGSLCVWILFAASGSRDYFPSDLLSSLSRVIFLSLNNRRRIGEPACSLSSASDFFLSR